MCKEKFLCCITSLHKVDMSNVPICTNYKYVVGNKKKTLVVLSGNNATTVCSTLNVNPLTTQKHYYV